MKKIIYFGLFLMLILAGCSQTDEQYQDPLSDEVALKKASCEGEVFIVEPSGSDDTEALLQAFANAKAAGPGSVVQLSAGQYYTGLIEVQDFYGTFRGAGKGITIITPLKDLPCYLSLMQNRSISLFKFFRGDLTVADMSFVNGVGQACIWGGDINRLWSFLGFFDYAITDLIDDGEGSYSLPWEHSVRAVVDRVGFEGSWSPDIGQQVFYAIGIYADFAWAVGLPWSNADVKINNCDFNVFDYAIQYLGIAEGGLTFSNNKCRNIPNSLYLVDFIGGKYKISDNFFTVSSGGGGIFIQDLFYDFNIPKLSQGAQFDISGNKFLLDGAFTGVNITSERKMRGIPDVNNPLLAHIRNNLFEFCDDSAPCGIWNFSSKDAAITNNKFTGHSVWTGIASIFADNTLLLGNNFSTMTDTDVHIFLAELTSGCTVVGGNNKGTAVVNLGTNNVITGVKVTGGHNIVGQTITDNYAILRDNMKKVRQATAP